MAGVSVYPRHDREVRVGVAGPREFVERVMLSGLPGPGGTAQVPPSEAELGISRRLVMAPYLSEHEAAERVGRLAGSVSAWLFASRITLDYVRRSGALSCPATCIQLGGTPLYAALLRARQDGLDPGQASFDGLSRVELDAGLADLGVPADGAHLREETATTAAMASFHERLWRLGQTSAAFTCLEQVANRLADAGVPVVRLRPTDQSIRSALQVATLLASHQVLAESQLAVAIVEVPALRHSSRRPAPRHATQELQLTVHRFLVREAQRIQGTVSQLGEHAFLIMATRNSLAAAGDPPFAAAARNALGVTLDVGVGTGRSEHEAEAQARLAMGQAAHGRAGVGFAGRAGRSRAATVELPGMADFARQLQDARPAPAGRGAADSLSRIRALETLSRLAQKLAADAAPVVDAELTGQLLSVTPRTARRQLRALVDEGLALPLPPTRRQHPGRPRLAYRLVVEKLERGVSRSASAAP
jgi:hypothetical protein